MAMKLKSSATKTQSITEAQSTTLCKNLFRAAFSSIAFLRNFFDDDCFQVGTIGSTKYHKIVGAKAEDARAFVDWFEKGVFDALQRKYLEVVLLQVFSRDPKAKKGSRATNPEPKDLLECFSFYVSYTGEGTAQLRVSGSDGATSRPQDSRETVKKNTSEVLRSLVEMTSTLRPLPKHRILSVKLLYTPQTPVNYEPPLFTKAAEDETCWFEDEPIRVHAGRLRTPYHQMSMAIRVKATDDNQKAKVLRATDVDAMEVEGTEDRAVDVGGSQANSGRIAPPMQKALRESQPAEGGGRAPLKPRGRKEEASLAIARSERRASKRRYQDSADRSPDTEFASSQRRKLSSTVKKRAEK